MSFYDANNLEKNNLTFIHHHTEVSWKCHGSVMGSTFIMRVSIIRIDKDGQRYYRLFRIEELVRVIREEKYLEAIQNYRIFLPYDRRDGIPTEPSGFIQTLAEVPFVCFASEMIKRDGKEVAQEHNPLLLMTISNLRNEALTEQLKQHATTLPYSRLIFVGADGVSLNIVCELQAINGNADSPQALLQKGFAALRKVYGDFLHVQPDVNEPKTDAMCRVSSDATVFYNPHSIVFPVDMSSKVSLSQPHRMVVTVENREERYRWLHIFINNHRKAQEECFCEDDADGAALLLLARYCHETGIPQGLAERFATTYGGYQGLDVLVRDIFAVEYEKELRTMANPRKHLNKTAQLMLRTQNFLNVHYRMRRNVLNGVVEYRLNDGTDFQYHILTPEVQNSMTIMALESGLDTWDKDLNRYIHSDRIPQYNPITDFLDSLPEWDGKDRVTELANRVPTTSHNWQSNFHTWMLSMVAQWMGRDDQHGNAIAPILIGSQATGKSTFCRMLLPESLQEYYNDSIHFKDDKSVFLALSSFALINIDEFDSLSRSQQPLLKYLLSKTDVKYRAAYRNHIEQHKRYASFIATTNKPQPLVDTTGSRRFICAKVNGLIDFVTPLDHAQLYAQLFHEVMHGKRYWFTKEEADAITQQNTPFMQSMKLSDLLLTIYRLPTSADNTVLLSVEEIVKELTGIYPDSITLRDANMSVGKAMKLAGFEQERTSGCRKYRVAR
ncbi:MAG: hypothetical protein KBT34_14805 [Prevotella sp.]|nr:hypothetical protein [Candidatus Prevotella equi]